MSVRVQASAPVLSASSGSIVAFAVISILTGVGANYRLLQLLSCGANEEVHQCSSDADADPPEPTTHRARAIDSSEQRAVHPWSALSDFDHHCKTVLLQLCEHTHTHKKSLILGLEQSE